MALPPPLPSRVPPPVPLRGGGPPLLPSQRAIGAFDTEGARFTSDRELSGDRLRGFEEGKWIAVNSTWLNRIQFKRDVHIDKGVLDTGTMLIEFLSLAICQYDNTPWQDFVDLLNSSSKGRWTYYECKLRHRQYTLIRGPQRKVTQAMKLMREPTSQFAKQRTYRKGKALTLPTKILG